ncbi:MAG TPA: aminotransferase class V-fold PLP-dependent enzyme [Longimicrobiales bacterium]|nr:aminotransferase class V-fold PLP-dependent enzyme [Longimicrobiales bacterium]
MKPLFEQQDQLPDDRRVPLAISGDEFRRIGHELVDTIAALLSSYRERPLTPDESPADLRALIGGDASLPEHGADAGELIAASAQLLREHSLFNGHPLFFGYITSSPAPIGILADMLAAAINPNLGLWRLSPIATEIEQQAVRWVAELIGYPAECGGLFVSGGNMANTVALYAARAAAADWDIRAGGVAGPGARRLRVYASGETHTWIHKAADLCGIGTDSIRWIPIDERQRMDVSALRDAIERDIEAGDRPMMVAGTAGTVSTGAVDPVGEIADLCLELGVWFHVDGAYGALAANVDGTPDDLRAIGRADSVAVDPHKWLYAPLEAGCTLVRDPAHLRNAFSYHPPYYHFGEEAVNYVDYGPQNSRGFRALKVWLGLRQAGREGALRMIADDIRLSERLHANVQREAELEPLTQELSITTFRYIPPDLRASTDREEVRAYLDEINQALLERIQSSGEAFVSNAVIDGTYTLRACIVNMNTRSTDVDALPGIVVRLGRELDATMRPADLQRSQ